MQAQNARPFQTFSEAIMARDVDTVLWLASV